ncbi:MAG TPA: hypothetical protein VMW38_24955 [Terriglobia bacterium]|nr:hypothetical protein [Terriglobia bacterium]
MNASSQWKSKLAGVTPPRPDNPSLGEEERSLLQFRFGKEGEISAEGAYIKMNKVLKLVGAVAFFFSMMFMFSHDSAATQQFAKDTGKKCLDCHKKIPKKGDKDMQLTELGQKFKDNGNKMPK